VLGKVIDWCITNWYVLSASVAEEKAILDICKELHCFSQTNGETQMQLKALPIHSLMPKKGQESISTLIVFKKNGTVITPMSKIRFFADADQTKLVKEL